jgi:hypothetical protein
MKKTEARNTMSHRAILFGCLAALSAASASAQIVDYSKYPSFNGQWERYAVPGVGGQPSFDQTKFWGRGQQAPLTPEYQAIHDASLADQAAGGLGGDLDHARCGAEGMPFEMVAFRPLEFVVTPETTYIIIADYDPLRRVYTDGRDWSDSIEPTFSGYSIGRWIDENHDGRYNVLEVETRAFKGPREFDATGLPMHKDNQSIFKERFYLDKANPDILHDEITVIDHALTRPWTVDKRYTRNHDLRPEWFESICAEYNAQTFIGNQHYYLSADGLLMPTRPGQSAPDLRYFNKAAK